VKSRRLYYESARPHQTPAYQPPTFPTPEASPQALRFPLGAPPTTSGVASGATADYLRRHFIRRPPPPGLPRALRRAAALTGAPTEEMRCEVGLEQTQVWSPRDQEWHSCVQCRAHAPLVIEPSSSLRSLHGWTLCSEAQREGTADFQTG
jgi:hypothetical protein